MANQPGQPAGHQPAGHLPDGHLAADSGGGSVGFTNPKGSLFGLPLTTGEWPAFITAAGGTTTKCFVSNCRNALAAALSISEPDALNISMGDMWRRYALAGFPLV